MSTRSKQNPHIHILTTEKVGYGFGWLDGVPVLLEARQFGAQHIRPVHSAQDNSAPIKFGTKDPGQFATTL